MRPETKYTPFDGKIIITLTDENGEALPIADYSDIQVYLFVNGTLKLKYRKTAATGFKAWTDGEDEAANVIHCPLTVAETTGWRGLINSATVLVKDDAHSEPIVKVEFIAQKSGI